MKNILVIGTSHSEATCLRDKNDSCIEMLVSGRWHDYFKTDYGYNVTKLARAGCTVQQQFFVVSKFLKDNPELNYDFAIIEGRGLETTISLPGKVVEGYNKNDPVLDEYYYRRWTVDESKFKSEFNTWNYKLEYDEFSAVSSGGISQNSFSQYQAYYADYVFSWQHAVDSWSANLALCKLLNSRCDQVKWFTLHNESTENFDLSNFIDYGETIMSDYILDDTWPQIDRTEFEDEYYCACGHFNEMGHEKLWYEYIKPRIQKYIQ